MYKSVSPNTLIIRKLQNLRKNSVFRTEAKAFSNKRNIEGCLSIKIQVSSTS
ncbi:hypothetical protein HMPREF1870_02205 [Bacteroidales bacterium KA00344]|nr:hypothetical protein HMPREF1870_02205 [Bacteroidales bacterium KA00344]